MDNKMKTASERLISLLEGDKVIPEIVKETGISDQVIRNWKKGGAPKIDNLAIFCEKRKVSPDWLLLGKEPDMQSDNQSEIDQEFTLIPLYDAVLSGGPGSYRTGDEIKASFAFRTEYIHRKGNGNHLCLFSVSGNSMSPEIRDGDIVMVDRSANDPSTIKDGKIYAFREEGVIKVKRLARQGGKIIVKSDNGGDKYEIENPADFDLFGLVIWVGHEIG